MTAGDLAAKRVKDMLARRKELKRKIYDNKMFTESFTHNTLESFTHSTGGEVHLNVNSVCNAISVVNYELTRELHEINQTLFKLGAD